MRTGADAIETSPASLSAQLIGQIAEPNRLLIRESCAGVEAQLQQLCCDIERVVRRGVQLRGSLERTGRGRAPRQLCRRGVSPVRRGVSAPASSVPIISRSVFRAPD